jgi:hypothetical protein
MRKSDLTSKMLAYRYLKDFDIDQSIDWAVEMLSLGYETPLTKRQNCGILDYANPCLSKKHSIT